MFRNRSAPRHRELHSYCRSCEAIRGLEWARRNREKVKLCKHQSYLRHREKNLQYQRNNRNRVLLAVRKYQKANPEKIKRYGKLYRTKNAEAIRERRRAWYESHREIEIRNLAIWQSKNRGKCRSYSCRNNHNRRARLRNVRVYQKLLISDFINRIKSAKFIQCYWGISGINSCPFGNRNVPLSKRQIDHIIPISRDGAHSVHNLCASCSSCNSSKKDRSAFVWHGQGQLVLS